MGKVIFIISTAKKKMKIQENSNKIRFLKSINNCVDHNINYNNQLGPL